MFDNATELIQHARYMPRAPAWSNIPEENSHKTSPPTNTTIQKNSLFVCSSDKWKDLFTYRRWTFFRSKLRVSSERQSRYQDIQKEQSEEFQILPYDDVVIDCLCLKIAIGNCGSAWCCYWSSYIIPRRKRLRSYFTYGTSKMLPGGFGQLKLLCAVPNYYH